MVRDEVGSHVNKPDDGGYTLYCFDPRTPALGGGPASLEVGMHYDGAARRRLPNTVTNM
jgi:hypothetical protein